MNIRQMKSHVFSCSLITLLGCANDVRTVTFDLYFADREGQPFDSGSEFYISETRGWGVASIVDLGKVVVCDGGIVRLSGSFNFNISVKGIGVVEKVTYHDVQDGIHNISYNSNLAVGRLEERFADLPLLNECPS